MIARVSMRRRVPKWEWISVILTYALMVWGNMVSATGSGLACPDWPHCNGLNLPEWRPDIALEMGHRFLAAVTSVFILITLFRAWRNSASGSVTRGVIQGIGILLLVQILLGGVTVLLELPFWVSTTHLFTALLVFSGLIWIAAEATWSRPALESGGKPLRLARAGLVALMVQLLLGGLVRHTHAGLACPEFPACIGGGFLPQDWSPQAWIAFAHRWVGVLLLGVMTHLPMSLKKPSILSWALCAGAWTQVGLGVLTVLGALSTPLRGTHAALGYLLWAGLFIFAVRVGLSFKPLTAVRSANASA